MKTPEQIAEDTARKLYGPGVFAADLIERQPMDGDMILGLMAEAIEADRVQRGIVEQVVEVLDERGESGAAQLVRDTDPDDDLWDNYIGPMIDSIQRDYGAIAADSEEEKVMEKQTLTPYDTGKRLEPAEWSTSPIDNESPIWREFAEDRYGKVDFDDENGDTLFTVWVERDEQGAHIMHVQQTSVVPVVLRIHGGDCG